MVFASQGATAIANARAHRDERHARADLEALIETSPVGVVVLDTRTAKGFSFNRDAGRSVNHLRPLDHPSEELLEVIACRVADGQEVSLAALRVA